MNNETLVLNKAAEKADPSLYVKVLCSICPIYICFILLYIGCLNFSQSVVRRVYKKLLSNEGFEGWKFSLG